MQDEMYIVGEMQEKEEFLNLMRKYIKRTFSINPVAGEKIERHCIF